LGVQHYFANAIAACLDAWPALAQNGLLGTHAGASDDPLLMQWDSAMVAPATPGYSFYLSPSSFTSWTQPGLKTALDACVCHPRLSCEVVVSRTAIEVLSVMVGGGCGGVRRSCKALWHVAEMAT
jgi:hypothetical protein